MNAAEALAFVASEGIVLMPAKGPAPRLVDAIAGETVKGSWWGHPRGQLIFRVASEVTESADVLTCPLLGGKVTLVHRRLWPALVRLRDEIGDERLARTSSEHTATGAHERKVEPLDQWLPSAVAQAAVRLTVEDARALLAPWLTALTSRPKTTRAAGRS